jgi:hypothetical protein
LLVGPVAGLGAACFRRFIKFVEGARDWDRIGFLQPLGIEPIAMEHSMMKSGDCS